MKIRYLKNQDIDKKRWDCLIEESPNGRIYAYSWYLDIVSDHWDALVAGDYEYVMPIPWNSRYGITYSVTPYFVQQLGIFSRGEISDDMFRFFLKVLPWKIRYLNLNVNASNLFVSEKLKIKQRTNYILDISKSYEEIRAGYKPDARNKLRKTQSFVLKETDDIQGVVNNYKDWNGYLTPFHAKDYDIMLRLMLKTGEEDHLITCLLLDEKEEINASGFFLISHDRAYHILSSQSPEGRLKGAKHFFIDGFIRQYCQQIKIFDFEGSELPGVAEFFKKWGSVPEYYTNVEYAKFPVNLLK